ncbi:MAG TPA: GNAT family N-acetyltransferase [Vicinamibacteria bacterium]|nr:GNAT family N-acetyltransferase [Vicinamibacteria bacterium]
MSYEKRLESGIVICSTLPRHARALEQLQLLVFPTLDDSERFKEAHYRKHVEIFPEGQFVALDGKRVVGMTTTIRTLFDFDHPQHTFADMIQGGWLTSHDPEGDWLYGADIGTDPAYRRRGIARGLYAARHDTVKRLGLKGQVTVGMLRGYGDLKGTMSAEAYYQALLRGQLTDPTISAQMRIGFEPLGLVSDYLHDPACDNYGVLLVLAADKEVHSR